MLRLPSGNRAFAARIDVRVGSIFKTIPGPPPYGRSSTVLCTSVANSRGVLAFTVTAPRSMARPRTPTRTASATNSGNSVTTSMRMAPFRINKSVQPVQAPVEHDAPGIQVDFHDAVLHERDPMLPSAANHHHIAARRGAEMIHSPE